jgi:hypothetical protein
MKIDMPDGTRTIDAHDLGGLFDIPSAGVQALLCAGEITSRFESGADEDVGKVRLTLLHKTCRVRLTCSENGTVLKTSRVTLE